METNTGSDLIKQNGSRLLGNLGSTGVYPFLNRFSYSAGSVFFFVICTEEGTCIGAEMSSKVFD